MYVAQNRETCYAWCLRVRCAMQAGPWLADRRSCSSPKDTGCQKAIWLVVARDAGQRERRGDNASKKTFAR